MLQHSGLTLAYIGDALYELLVREYFINQGQTKVEVLHNLTVQYTSAEGQANAFEQIKSLLTEDEMAVFKRGRNAKTQRKARNADIATYRQSTGLEALIGYLYLTKQQDRLDLLFQAIMTD